MGSCFSQPDKPKVTSAQRAQIAQNVVLPKVTWEVDETWAKQNELFRQMAVEAGVDASAALQSTMFKRATDFLNRFVTNPFNFCFATYENKAWERVS